MEAGTDAPSFLAVMENAAIAPVIAFFTFIGSMGNVPLAAMLWSKDASFGGVMAFFGADLVAATVVYIHAKCYGLPVRALSLDPAVPVYGARRSHGALPLRRGGSHANETPHVARYGRFRDRLYLLAERVFVSVGLALLVLRARSAPASQRSTS